MFKKPNSLKIKPGDLIKHETKKHILKKFFLVFLVFLAYLLYISKKYGIQEGFFVAILTWSFFVLCTPIADAGFLIDLPLRLILKVRMFIAEIFVWIFALSMNIYAVLFNPTVYEKTKILKLFKYILENPLPFWSIILISMIGTFVSIEFGDELLDKTQHKQRKLYQKNKHHFKIIIIFFLFAISFVLYDFLLKKLGINLPI